MCWNTITDKLDLLDHIVVMEFQILFIKVNKQLPSHEVMLTMNGSSFYANMLNAFANMTG